MESKKKFMTKNFHNLVVRGDMKCGTTSLHDCLAMHTDVFMLNPEEVSFFSGEITIEI